MPAQFTLLPEARFWSKLSKNGPLTDQHPELGNCWDWTGARQRRQNGQLSYGYLKPRHGPQQPSHHLAWALAGGSPVPKGWEIGHTCDRVQCCRNDESGVYIVAGVSYERHGHLWLATHAANMADCSEKRRTAWQSHPEIVRRGEANSMARLTEAAVRDILIRYIGRTASQQTLADQYGVHPSIISMIVRGRRWATVAPEIPRLTKRQRLNSQ